MLTGIHIRNFKMLEDVDIELGKAVVFIGPNNSGKTAALQALALWDIGLRRWNEKRQGRKTSPEKRPGVTINRRDLISIPIPDANLLWRDLQTRDVRHIGGKQKTKNIRIDLMVRGVTEDEPWECGLEFDYANQESFYCRPLRMSGDRPPKRMPIPRQAASVHVAFLPPMSGLADQEFIKQPGEIAVLVGQGQTQVLRNLCYQIYQKEDSFSTWKKLVLDIRKLFGVELLPPKYIEERGEITMAYKEANGTPLDLSSSGRGLQQTLLLLTHLYANPGTVLLFDEPDAHLEVLRQRQIYQLLLEVAEMQNSQIITASHSEVVLNEAAGRNLVVAFVGKPHILTERRTQVSKALTDLDFDQYYQAEQTGWVLYLEGSTDLAILKAFAATLEHPALEYLQRPFVRYIGNQPNKARDHFFGLREAKPDLVGLALFDRLDKELQLGTPLTEMMWQRRELENYLCLESVLLAYARADQPNDLFGLSEANCREKAMRESIAKISTALKTLRKDDPWSPDIKASDDFLDPLFRDYFERLGLPCLAWKNDYHVLAHLVPKDQIDPEITEKLDALVAVARSAKPRDD